ncbi:uncharacterized protein LOC122388268 isoform X1 [Amphibalanus amphitrite]|uniref:uncharacterized protein LOC122388268 isoform X1 n=1 Tax=Amphibalanus amphitrite TaxID=1232801 RepID=UPI001C91063C|nr:uncharacterized protein LOC122388268 isoform X1 [Amphibalanus amphitrite]
MGKKKEPPKPTGGLEQSGIEKRLCNCICLCQLMSIISGVALLYLSVIVVSPAKQTLDAQFVEPSVVCTTLRVEDGDCELPSCGEWCMSKGGTNCPIVYAKVRHKGTTVRFSQCSGMQSRFCSAQKFNETQSFVCSEKDKKDDKRGQCDRLNRIMDCRPTRMEKKLEGLRTNMTSLCRNITAIKECVGKNSSSSAVTPQGIMACSQYTCNDLKGIYECINGNCKKYEDPVCTDRCTSLKMGNVGIVTPNLFRWGTCEQAEVNGTVVWNDEDKPLSLYCSRMEENESGTELTGEDCLNGTLDNPDHFSDITNYTEILALLDENAEPLDVTHTALPSERSVLISNGTKVMINIQGCVNTLQKECTAWLDEKSRDGNDGMHPAVYPCYVTPESTSYVVTNYNRSKTVFQMVLATVVPSALLILSCCCLVLCGKTVGVNEFGLFFCKPCHKQEGDGGKQPAKQSAP